MLSKRSAKCASCVHCIDFSLDSPVPISCDNNGETNKTVRSPAEKVKSDFVVVKRVGIPKDANCPNYQETDELQSHNLADTWSKLAIEHNEWPTEKAMEVINENEEWSFLRDDLA